MRGKSAPFVSVVIPAHNRCELLGGSIESALRQHGGPLDEAAAIEVIVVDDASTDGTPEVIRRYQPPAVSLRNDRSLERGASRNLGAAKARGHWLAFLDSDDEWEDGKLAAQLEALDGARACVCPYQLIDAHGLPLGVARAASSNWTSEIDVVNPFPASTLLVDRSLFVELGGFPEQREVQGSEDWLLLVKLVRAGYAPASPDAPLVRYRIHSENSTTEPANNLRTTLAAVDWLEDNGLVKPERAALSRAQKYETAAGAHALRGEIGVAFRYLRTAMGLAPAGQRLALIARTTGAANRLIHRRFERASTAIFGAA